MITTPNGPGGGAASADGGALSSGAISSSAEAGGASQREMMRLVAELYYVRELGQPEIATLTGFSVSKVSRLLAAARAVGVVRISVESAPSEPTPLAKACPPPWELRFGLRPATRPNRPLPRGCAEWRRRRAWPSSCRTKARSG